MKFISLWGVCVVYNTHVVSQRSYYSEGTIVCMCSACLGKDVCIHKLPQAIATQEAN